MTCRKDRPPLSEKAVMIAFFIIAIFLLLLVSSRSAAASRAGWSGQTMPAPTAIPIVVCEADQKSQTRPTFVRVNVPKGLIETDDGDTITINWSDGDKETVRFFGADTAEIAHPEMGWDEGQPFGPEGREFLVGLLGKADLVELIRGACSDRYGRTLGYLFVNDFNYSAMVVAARLAYETISKYGPQGFPAEAAEVMFASLETLKAGPLPFENPHDFRAKMREKAEAKAKAEQPPLIPAECRYEFNVLTDGRVIVRHHQHPWADFRNDDVMFRGEQVIEAWDGSCTVVFNNMSHLDWFGFDHYTSPPPINSVMVAIQIGRSDDLRENNSFVSMTFEDDAFTVFNPRFAKMVLTGIDPTRPITLFIFRVKHGEFEGPGAFGETRCLGELSADARTVKCGGTDLRLELLEVRKFVPFPYASPP